MPDKRTVYIETSVVSYLVAQPSDDPIKASRQILTNKWWSSCSSKYQLLTSPRVIAEAAEGDTREAAKRLAVLADLDNVEINQAVLDFARIVLAETSLPATAEPDAMHIATAVVNGVQYLLTWNHKHMANIQIRNKIDELSLRHGFSRTMICTPEELDPEELE